MPQVTSSTDGQTLDAQQSALRAAGATKVFSEKISGAITDRKALARAIAALSSGDTLIVTRLDRLAPEHQGPTQHAGCNQQGRGRLPFARRHLGRHNNATWKANGHGAGGFG